MSDEVAQRTTAILEKVRARDGNQTEFLQAVEEVIESLIPLFNKSPQYLNVSTIRFLTAHYTYGTSHHGPWISPDYGLQTGPKYSIGNNLSKLGIGSYLRTRTCDSIPNSMVERQK